MAEIGGVYPGTSERVVDKVKAPDGGYWLLGERGGVFAEGGAPFLGSYFTIPEGDRNDPNRRFKAFEQTEGGGYALVSVTGEKYVPPESAAYQAPTATQPAPTPPPPPPLTPAQQRAGSSEGASARASIEATLTRFGLPASLATTLWNNWYVDEGRPLNQILLDLEGTDEFKTRFPGLTMLKERRNRGEAVYVPGVDEYLQLETGIASVLEDAGMPKGFYDDPSDFARFIGGSTSPKEVEDRITFARTVAFSAPVQTRQELDRLYGIGEGELIAYVLDPDRALPEIQKRVLAGGVAGAARQTGFGLLTAAEAEQLAGAGVSEAAAGERFGELALMNPLFEETAEEATDLGRAEQLGYAGGASGVTETLRRRRAARTARFEGGGGAAGIGGQRSGLGTAQ